MIEIYSNFIKGQCEVGDVFIATPTDHNSCLVAENFIINSKAQLEARSGSYVVDPNIGPTAKVIFTHLGYLGLRYTDPLGVDTIGIYYQNTIYAKFTLTNAQNLFFVSGHALVYGQSIVLIFTGSIAGTSGNATINWVNPTTHVSYSFNLSLANHNVGFLITAPANPFSTVAIVPLAGAVNPIDTDIFANQLIVLTATSIIFADGSSPSGPSFTLTLIGNDNYTHLIATDHGFIVYGPLTAQYFTTTELNQSIFTITNIRIQRISLDGIQYLDAWENLMAYSGLNSKKIYVGIIGSDKKIVYNIPSSEDYLITNIHILNDFPPRIMISRTNGMIDVITLNTDNDAQYNFGSMGLTRWTFYEPCTEVYGSIGRKLYLNIDNKLQVIDLDTELYMDGQNDTPPGPRTRIISDDLIIIDPDNTLEPTYTGYDIFYKFVSRDYKYSIGFAYGKDFDNIVPPNFYGIYMGANLQDYILRIDGSRFITIPTSEVNGATHLNSDEIPREDLVRKYSLKKFPHYKLQLDGLVIDTYGLISIDPFSISGALVNYKGK
jgi:hypothetical protein